MRNGVNALWALYAAAALAAWFPRSAVGEAPPGRDLQEDENRWVPSLAILGGASFGYQDGSSNSSIDYMPESASYRDGEIREPQGGRDLLVAPFVGAALELMAPALPVPTRPRFFFGAEILPTFAAERNLTVDGDPGCVRGFRPSVPPPPCARDEAAEGFPRRLSFSEDSALGRGSETVSEITRIVFGANAGVAVPFGVLGRQLRFKPSVAWINYRVQATGLVVEADCNPAGVCTDTFRADGTLSRAGNLREIILMGSASKRFNAVGPAIDLEVDTGRFGPLGASLFLGARFYRVLGDRSIGLGNFAHFDPLTGTGPAVPAADGEASWDVDLDPWLYRAHVGFRLHWLGSAE